MKLFILTLILLLPSCNNDNNEDIHSIFKEVQNISSEELSKIEEPIITGEFIIHDSLFIVQTFRDQYSFHVINPRTGKTIKKIIPLGKSNKETLGIQFSNIDKSNLYLYDYILKSLITIDKNEILMVNELEKQKISEIKDFFFNRVYKISHNRFLMCGNSTDMESIFALVDENYSIIEKFGKFNLKGGSEIDSDTFGVASWGFVSIHDNKIAYASTSGNIIKFYRIENDNITLIAEYVYDLPNIKSLKDGNFSTIDLDDKAINGTLSITTSDSCCFLLNTYGFSRDNIRTSKEILVFDWAGNPLKKIVLDRFVNNISYSATDNSLYAISIDKGGENIILKYHL